MRDSLIALLAVCATLAIVTPAQNEKPRMESSIFDWNAVEATPTKVGSRRQFFQSPTATLDEIECHVTTLNPGESPHPPHKHPDEELIIINEGVVEATVNGQTKRVGPGSVLFMASNQLHGVRNAGHTSAAYHVIRWKSPGMLKDRAKE
jgi:quercetin dioxygenase-like cupin family protein